METELPTSLSGWVSLAVQLGVVVLAVAGLLWRAIKKPLEDEINGLGRRVKIVEDKAMQHGTLIDKNDRSIERLGGAVVDGQKSVAKIEGVVERLVTAIERNRDAHAEEDSEIRERLVRIETKVDTLTRGNS
ncbi:MAG: hypothetical protein M3Q39_00970 [Actinomycetota bacterium]|nr:hypothetical protein [Actinomycetota bacterium]